MMRNKEIIEEIKNHLTGDKEIDVTYLQTELSIYRNMKNDEVIYAIANLLFKYLDPEIKEKLDLKTHEILDQRRAKYESVVQLVDEGKLKEAEEILIELISVFRKATYTKEQNYFDFDQMIEYFVFCETVVRAKELKVKRYPEPVTYYFFQLAEIYTQEENYKKAAEVLEEALVYNPRCQYVFQTLILIYEKLNKHQRAFELAKESLKYAYTKDQISFAYLKMGDYYDKIKCYDISVVLYIYSTFYYETDENMFKALHDSQKHDAIDYSNEDEVEDTMQKYNIQKGPSELVLNAMAEFIEYTKKIRDYESTEYILNIAFELTGNEKYKKELASIEKDLEEKRQWKENFKF